MVEMGGSSDWLTGLCAARMGSYSSMPVMFPLIFAQRSRHGYDSKSFRILCCPVTIDCHPHPGRLSRLRFQVQAKAEIIRSKDRKRVRANVGGQVFVSSLEQYIDCISRRQGLCPRRVKV